MARNWTEEQRTAFSERERTLLVSAAAGSGKTATLTERILRTLTDPAGGGDISRMLIVTFTRAAAGELRTRIARELNAALASGGRTAHLSRQLLLLPAAHISTIDSFCLDLVRTHAVRLGISPSFRLADATENRLLLESILERLLDEAYAGELSTVDSEDFLLLADALARKQGDAGIPALLLSLYDSTRGFARSYRVLGDMAETLAENIARDPFETPWGAYIREKTEEELKSYLSLYDSTLPLLLGDEEGAAKWYAGYAAEREDLSSAICAADGGYTALRDALSVLGKHKLGGIGEDKKTDVTRAARAMRDEYFRAVKQLSLSCFSYTEEEWSEMLTALSHHIRPLADFLSEFGARVDSEKHRRGIMDFADVAHAAYALLYEDGAPTPLAREISSEFDYVYVDEYQDVNDLQHRIFEAIAPPRGRFMVGDVKQSIYGFRGAQPEIFAATRAAFPAYDREHDDVASSLSLTMNFRSFAPVLDFVNRVFGGMMDTGLGENIGYRPEDALAAGLPTPAAAAPVTVALFSRKKGDPAHGEEEPAEGEEASEPPEEETDEDDEARYVADEIARLLATGKKADGSPIRPADIAILARGSAAFPKFASALAARGIRAEGPSKKGFFLNPEILLAISLLSVIDNPRRDVQLAGLLRSPLYGFTMDELIALRREADEDAEGRALTLYEALRRYADRHPDFKKGREFLSALARFRRVAEGTPVDRLIWQLYRETGLLAIAGADHEGHPEERRQNLMLLYDYARRFESSSFRGLYNFIDYIGEAIDRGESLEERGGDDGAADAVSIMTMHHAKGLEYPVCFVADAGRSFRLADASAPILFDRALGCALQMRDKSGYARLQNPVYKAISSAITDRGIEEETRILYVALTRARERLYVTGTVSDVEKLYARAKERHAHFSMTDAYAARSYAEMILATAADSSDILLFGDGALLNTPEAPLLRFLMDEESGRTLSPPAALPTNGEEAPPAPADLRETLRRRFESVYPDRYLTDLPKKLSVSRLYPTVLDGADADIPLLATAGAPVSSIATPQKEDTVALTPTAVETDTFFAAFRLVDEYEGTRVFRIDGNGAFSWDDVPEPAFAPGEGGDPLPVRSGYLPRFMGGDDGLAAKKGTATHLFLQFADFAALRENGARAELSRLLEKKFLSPEDAELVRLSEIEAFMKSDLFAALTAGGQLYRELRFHARLPAAAFTADPERAAAYRDCTVLVQGVMDGVLLRDDGALWLFDYKTDRLTPDEKKDPALAAEKLTGRYRAQLSYYAAACRQIFGKDPDRVMLYSLALGDTVEIFDLIPLGE